MIDFWFPIDNFKKTIGGELIKHYIFQLGDDNDHNLAIIPTEDFQADLRFSMQKAIKRMDGEDPLVDDDVPETMINCGEPEEDRYRHYRIQSMELEIDLHETNAKTFFNTNTYYAPKINSQASKGDVVFAFGPWVTDAGHCHKPEIHPAEQIWWRKRNNAAIHNYFLLLSADQSHRFSDKDNFDVDEIRGPDRYLKEVWAPHPLKGAFAIVFTIKAGKERCYFDITRIAGQNITAYHNDGQLHYLIKDNDTLVVVKEPYGADQIKVSFQNICSGNFTPNNDGSTNIYGFLILESQVGKSLAPFPQTTGGYQFLNVKKEIKPERSRKLPVIK